MKKTLTLPDRGSMTQSHKADPVAVALAKACQKMDRSMGLAHGFTVHTVRADGTGAMVQSVSVIANGWADAWGLMGDAIGLFMNSVNGRMVTTVHAEHPFIKEAS